jgi:hypothetical protein
MSTPQEEKRPGVWFFLMSTHQEEKRPGVWLLMGVSYFALGRSRHNISLVFLRKHPPNTLRNFSECFL